MKRLLILSMLLIAASICYATSNITFSGGRYETSVLLSDEDCKIVGLNVSDDNPNIISIDANEITVFSKTESGCKKKTIHLWCPQRNLSLIHEYFAVCRVNKIAGRRGARR